ncbi:hypothetical protein RRG08_012208 [Elysia crispata]|uniref:Uncharacterized protein n=1 Tax=Elysia crispata TaxID=231223 RepID=A0AAE0ZK11_9GAST|nr:hypothetical protein RRG08_012208 [Elysia crispata]
MVLHLLLKRQSQLTNNLQPQQTSALDQCGGESKLVLTHLQTSVLIRVKNYLCSFPSGYRHSLIGSCPATRRYVAT